METSPRRAAANARPPHVLTLRPYRFFVLGTTVSMFGNGMQFVANTWLSYQLSGAAIGVAGVLICTALPGVLLAPFTGVLVDRMDRRLVASTVDAARSVLLLAVPALYFLGLLHLWHLYALVLLLATGDEIYRAAVMGLVREIVPPEQLLEANSATATGNQIGALAGAAAAGLIIAATSAPAAILINAATFVASSLCMLAMRRGRVVHATAAPGASRFASYRRDIADGIAYIAQRYDIIPAYLAMLLLVATMRTINVLLVPFAVRVLHGGAQAVGVVDAAFACGAIVGGYTLPIVARAVSERALVVGGAAGVAAGLFVFSIAPSVLLAMVAYFAIGVFFQLRIYLLTWVQRFIPTSHQGRVHAAFNAVFAFVSILVYGGMGLLDATVSPRVLYAVQAAVVLGGFVLLVPLQRRFAAARLAAAS